MCCLLASTNFLMMTSVNHPWPKLSEERWEKRKASRINLERGWGSCAAVCAASVPQVSRQKGKAVPQSEPCSALLAHVSTVSHELWSQNEAADVKCLFLNSSRALKGAGGGVEESRGCSVPCEIQPQEYLLGEGLASCPSWRDGAATDSLCVLPPLCSEKRKSVSVCSVKSGKEVSAGDCPFQLCCTAVCCEEVPPKQWWPALDLSSGTSSGNEPLNKI